MVGWRSPQGAYLFVCGVVLCSGCDSDNMCRNDGPRRRQCHCCGCWESCMRVTVHTCELCLVVVCPPVMRSTQTFWDVWGGFIIVCLGLVVISVVILILVLVLPFKSYIEVVRAWMEDHPVTGPLLYFSVFTILIMLCFPVGLTEMMAVLVFGPYYAFGLNLAANMVRDAGDWSFCFASDDTDS